MPITLWIMVVLAAAVVIPVWTATVIMRKAGFSPWWGLLNAIPVVSLILVWVFAFIHWPNADDRKTENQSSNDTT